MVDFASKLLKTGPSDNADVDFASMLLGGGKPTEKRFIENPYMKETSEISTITGKPIQESTTPPGDYTPAEFSTLVKAGFVDNNDAKIKLFSDARGIPTDRYEVKDGQIFFQGEDGNMYPEAPKEISNLLKKLVAEIPSEGLPDMGAAAGAALGGGPGGATLGAGVGELIRKEVGRIFFGDDQNMTDYAADIGLQAVMGLADATVAKKMAGAMSSRKIKKQTGGKISDNFTQIVGDLSPEQRLEGQIVKGKADAIGVDLKPHQAMEDPTLTGYYKLLRDNPKTAREIRLSDDKLDAQVQQAGEDLIRSISRRETDPFEVGQELSDAGMAAIERMKAIRGDAVKGLYDGSRDVADVNISPVLEEIANLKTKVKPGMKAHSALNRLERMLLNKNDEIGPRKIPETQLEIIDNVKQEIDAILSGKDASAITNKLKRKMQGIKDLLTTQTDKVSREYQVGRALFAAASPKITRAEKGILGALSRMQADEQKEQAVRKVFASTRSIKLAKQAVEKVNPELWPDVVAELFRSEFESAAKVAQGAGGKVLNRPGKYTAKMWDLSTRKKIEVATKGMKDGNGDPLFSRISDFFDVMQKASIGQGKESATQPRMRMERDLQGLPGKMSSSMMNLRQAAVNFGLGASQEKAFDKNAKKLLNLMQTPEGVDLIAKAKGYGPKTEKGMIAATTLLMMATETNAGKVNEIIQTYRGR